MENVSFKSEEEKFNSVIKILSEKIINGVCLDDKHKLMNGVYARDLSTSETFSNGKRTILSLYYSNNIIFELFFNEETGFPQYLRIMVSVGGEYDNDNPILFDYDLSKIAPEIRPYLG